MMDGLYLFAECVQILLKHGAMVKTKNVYGWNCLEEAISYGDRQTSKPELLSET